MISVLELSCGQCWAEHVAYGLQMAEKRSQLIEHISEQEATSSSFESFNTETNYCRETFFGCLMKQVFLSWSIYYFYNTFIKTSGECSDSCLCLFTIEPVIWWRCCWLWWSIASMLFPFSSFECLCCCSFSAALRSASCNCCKTVLHNIAHLGSK